MGFSNEGCRGSVLDICLSARNTFGSGSGTWPFMAVAINVSGSAGSYVLGTTKSSPRSGTRNATRVEFACSLMGMPRNGRVDNGECGCSLCAAAITTYR